MPIPIAFTLAALMAGGCGDSNAVRVKLQAQPLPQASSIYLQIEAQVAGPTDGLQYKWFAVAGECEPQASDKPKTIFKFAEGVRQDEVSVELWRNDKQLAQSKISVKFDKNQTPDEHTSALAPRIKITGVPPAELGGPDTHADIAGIVGGKIPADCVVAIYSRASGYWFVQPEAAALHNIHPDGSWASWIHTGTKYAALLVPRNYEPLTRLDMLPQISDTVLALDIVEGLSKQQPSNAAPTAARAVQ